MRKSGSERLGMSMIFATLAVIVFIVATLIHARLDSRAAELRVRGVNLVRLLAEIPYQQFVAGAPRRGILNVLYESAAEADLAYGVVTSAEGQPRAQIAAPGVIIPAATPGARPSDWLGERVVALPDAREVMEFYSPLLAGGELAGHVRLGFFRPGFGLDSAQISLFASLALPVFLLTPLFYFLIRREVRPLRQANAQIQTLIEDRALQTVDIRASGELGDFIRRFNAFIEVAQQRIGVLEGERAELLTSSKLLNYQRVRTETVLRSFPEAVLVLDDTGASSYANPRMAQLVGRQAEDLLGRKPAEWCEEPALRECLTRPRPGAGGTHVTLPSAPDREFQVKAYPLFSPRTPSDILGTLVVVHDITEEMLAKRSRGEFVAHVAHELKTPLNVLAMYAEALQGEDGDSESFRIEAVNVINDEVARLSGLISNLLSLTKIETGSLGVERQRVKLRDLLEDAFHTVARSGRHDELRFELNLPREISPVLIDKELMRIAINNLLTNAIKYNNPGGTVTLSAEETDEAIRVVVSDTGIGISAEDQRNIFGKFYRSESDEVRSRTGHGLGLPLARDIVQLHHGELSVDSAPGQGARFVIQLKKETGLLQQAI